MNTLTEMLHSLIGSRNPPMPWKEIRVSVLGVWWGVVMMWVRMSRNGSE